MELRFMANTANSSNNGSNNSNNTTTNNSCHNSNEKLNNEQENHRQTPPQRSTSSCETLEAVDGINTTTLANGLVDPNSPLSKPLPPLPTKNTTKLANHTTSAKTNSTTTTTTNHKTATTNNLNNSQAHLASQGIHHAQPYYQTPPTPTMMAKRDYQQPPPVPPHQNNNHTTMAGMNHHHLPPTGHHAPLTPSLDQQRRTLDRNVRSIPYPAQNSNNLPTNHDAAMNMDGMSTRIPSLRRTRRTSGSSSNNGTHSSLSQNPNGGLGIPITVAGSPRVQRSPMPARAAMMKQRSRLGSHNDNISSGSLNSIEV